MIGTMSQMQQQNAGSDARLVRPSPREREAIKSLLQMKPRPKTLNDADMKYLKELLNKPVWLGAEGRIMHEIWTEVTGHEWPSPADIEEGAAMPESK
jgi:hypothetical protein